MRGLIMHYQIDIKRDYYVISEYKLRSNQNSGYTKLFNDKFSHVITL